MTSLLKSLGDHVSGLDEVAFDRMLDARPDVCAALGLDEAEGATDVSVAAAASALSDSDGAFFALSRLPLPHVYVVAVLVAERESVRVGGGAPRVRELSQAEWARVLADFGTAFGVAHYADPGVTRVRLCRNDSGRDLVVDRIVDELVDAALVWPEQGRLRLHDALVGSFDVEAVLDSADAAAVLAGPPTVETVAYQGPDPAGAARASALAALEEAERLLTAVAAEPVALLKAGGVGAREIRRLGKAARIDAARVRLWLHLGEAAGLIGVGEDGVMATGLFDEWSTAEPTQRFLILVNGWLGMDAFPLAATADGGRAPVPLSEAAYLGPASMVRAAVVSVLRTAPVGRAATSESLGAGAAWSLPLVLGFGESGSAVVCSCGEVHDEVDDELWIDPAFAVAQVLAEAEVLGVVVAGALAPWFRFDVGGLASGEVDEGVIDSIVDALGSVLPPAVSEVRLQGDLTAVASGLPSAALAALLDGCARRESSGAAAVWRFSDASIRAFLDSGGDVEDLLSRLKACSVTGTVPQVLEYLIKDAGRVHGLIDVIATAAVLVAADDRLAAEIEVNRALGSLALRRVAPTVLVSAVSPAAVLDALRFAGYAPSAHQADGAVTVARTVGPRLGV
ncbi:MAG: helicase-associated domain-containing protein [Catenulispora sp.]